MNRELPDLIYGYDVKDIVRTIELLKEEGITAQSINKIVTPPNEQDVCEALEEYYDTKTFYESKEYGSAFYVGKSQKDMYGKEYVKKRVIVACYEGEIGFNASLPPRLITMIGRFYEKESERDV